MNRKTHPKIRASIFINKRPSPYQPEGVISVKVENVGRTLARDVMVELEIPLEMDGPNAIDGGGTVIRNDEGDRYQLRLVPNLFHSPIFPGADLILKHKILTQFEVARGGCPAISARHIRVSVFADEMPPLRTTLDFAPVIIGWTPIEGPVSS